MVDSCQSVSYNLFMAKKQDNFLLYLVIAVAVLAISMLFAENIRNFINQNIWASWLILYLFCLISGFCLSYIIHRFKHRSNSLFLTSETVLCIVGFFGFLLVGIGQITPIIDHYLWNGLVRGIILLSCGLAVFFSAVMFNKIFK